MSMLAASAFTQGFIDARLRSMGKSKSEFGFTGFATKLPNILDLTSHWTCMYCDRTNSMFGLDPRCIGCGAPRKGK